MRTRLLEIEKYVVMRTAYGVGAALAVISAIITLADFVALSRDVGVRAKDSGAIDLFGLTLLQSPSVILVLTPFAFLFGVLGAFVGLNRRSELIAMRAAGVSAWRFIVPAAAAAALAGVFVVLVANPIASVMNAQFERSKAAMMDGYLAETQKPIWLRQGAGKTQAIIRAAGRIDGPGVRLRDVSVWTYAVDRRGTPRFQHRIDAREAVLENRRWRLIDALDGAPGQPAARAPVETTPTNLTPRTASGRAEIATAVPFWSLPGVIARTARAGFSTVGYRLQLQQLLATPLLYAGMSILAAAFSLRLLRLGGLAQLAASAVALGFAFFFFNQLCSAFGKAEWIPPALAAWAPPLLALLSGVTLLLYTEDG
ncbi:MAG: LptF/LptG family permease [Caulobacteraceae bacterium]|nr:LptF/LptG family permease [Caulobacter sp.]